MINDKPLKVLIVDDTIVYRKIVSDVLSDLPDVEVVGSAYNGKAAITKIASLKPDLLTLDIEMPEMNGLEVLEFIKDKGLDVGAVMLSTLTHEGGEMTMKALELGAFDFILKPQEGSMAENTQTLKKTIVPILKAFARRNEIKHLLNGKIDSKTVNKEDRYLSKSDQVVQRMNAITDRLRQKSEIVAIGISTGGPKALAQMMPSLPSNLGAPILIVQHMPPLFTTSLAKSLDAKCSFEVKEAKDGEPVLSNVAFIAPGGKQMKIMAGADGKTRVIKITDDPPENNCKPSVDYLFRSIAHHYVGRATGVIMTGMGSDGFLGLELMKKTGSTIIAQNDETSVVYGMPKKPIDAGIVDIIAPLNMIAGEICLTVKKQ
ncbi:MAG: chemotaxis response regulator protein-glutamate methylesterase [Desulfobacterales bacterium]